MRLETIPDLLDRIADRYGDTSVAHASDQVMSYTEWSRRSLVVSAGLGKLGIGRGSLVALAFSSGMWLEYLIAYVATLRLGATVVSLPEGRNAADLGRLISGTGADFVVSGDADCPGVAGLRVPTVSYADVAPSEVTPSSVTRPGSPDVSPDECAEILFTSGTTGEPKPVWCSHADLTAAPSYESDSGEVRLMGFYPMGSGAAQGVLQQMLQPERYWSGRLEVWNVHKFRPRHFLEQIRQYKISALRLTPTLATLLVEELTRHEDRYDTSSVSRIKLSAAFSSKELLDRIHAKFPAAQITNIYGSTEGGRACLRMTYGSDDPSSLGRAAPGTEVEIRDPEGRAVSRGEIGEIWLRTLGWRSSRAPGPDGRIVPDVWATAGDLGRIGPDGSVYLFGRTKDIVNVGGVKVSPVAVEGILQSHPGIKDIAAFPIPDPLLGEVVGVAVVPKDEFETISAEDVLSFASGRLGSPEMPRGVLILEELPLNSAGKIDKRALAAGTWRGGVGPSQSSPSTAGQSPP